MFKNIKAGIIAIMLSLLLIPLTPNPAYAKGLQGVKVNVNVTVTPNPDKAEGVREDVVVDKAQSEIPGAPKKVVFRLDDIQDYYLEEEQKAIIDAFADYATGSQSISIGIIGDLFAQPYNSFAEEIKLKMEQLGEQGEVVCHSMTHQPFVSKSEEEQYKELSDCKDKFAGIFPGKEINTFIPPENEYNSDTIKAMNRAGYTILSSQCTTSLCPNPGDPTSMPAYLPAGASTGGWTTPYEMRPASEIFAEIQSQAESNNNQNWSVVMMHPQDFMLDDGISLDEEAIETLKELIDMCLDNGYELVTFTQLEAALGNPQTETASYGKTVKKSDSATKEITEHYCFLNRDRICVADLGLGDAMFIRNNSYIQQGYRLELENESNDYAYAVVQDIYGANEVKLQAKERIKYLVPMCEEEMDCTQKRTVVVRNINIGDLNRLKVKVVRLNQRNKNVYTKQLPQNVASPKGESDKPGYYGYSNFVCSGRTPIGTVQQSVQDVCSIPNVNYYFQRYVDGSASECMMCPDVVFFD